MAKIKFKNGQVEEYTIILSNRALQHLGQITGVTDVKYNANLNSANELSFTVSKPDIKITNSYPYKDIKLYQDYIWKNLVDFRVIYIKELEEYFEINVAVDDGLDTKKTIGAKSLCEAELSQANLYTIEVNTDSDIARDDYKETTFYNSEDTSCSLLHRVLSKVPHYKIGYVDKSLCNVQRTFSIDGTSIYDFLTGECSEQFDCLFQFDSATRTVSAYDLMTVCEDCGERGDFEEDKCPKCGSTNLKEFGEYTTIYVDKNNLTDSIHFEMDGDNVKNCFKLEAGDDDMTAAIRMLNPNGTDYIYIIRDDDKADMPKELVEKLDEYSNMTSEETENIKDITRRYYDLEDKKTYYQSAMMPSIEYVEDIPTLDNIDEPKEGIIYVYSDVAYLFDGEKFVAQNNNDTNFLLELAPLFESVTASDEASKLTSDVLSPIGLKEKGLHKGTNISTVSNAVKNYAKVFVKTAYVKLDIESDETDPKISFTLKLNEDGSLYEDENGIHYGTWHGRIKVINLSNKEDIAYTGYMDIEITDDYESFIRQKIDKSIKNLDDDEGSVFDVLSIEDIDDYTKALTLYCVDRLDSFSNAIASAMEILQVNDEAKNDEKSGEISLLYKELYEPYKDKLDICNNQLSIMKCKVATVQADIESVNSEREAIHEKLNLEKHLGDLYPIFCSYKREDKYSNSNYIYDGLNNMELIDRAEKFWELAKKEIYKSANGQYNISSTLYNLLVMEEFKPIVDYFELGNWIRVKVDGEHYNLRLIGYEINFGDLQNIGVTFSTVTKIINKKDERQSILESAKSMATNFGYVSKQAEKGQEANNNLTSIVQNGLDSSLVTIKNNTHEEVTYGDYGILLREYDDILDDYTDNQCKITHNAMVYTTDNWKTASQAIGEHMYTYYDNGLQTDIGYGLTSKFVQTGYIYGTQMIAGHIYSENYNPSSGIGSHFNLNSGTLELGKNFNWNGIDLTVTGTINAEAGQIGSDEYDYKWKIGNDENRAYIYNGTNSMTSKTVGTYLGTDGFRNYKSTSAYVNISNGVLDCIGAKIKGAITGGTISIGSNFSVDKDGNATLKNINATSGTFTGTINAEEGKIGGWTIGEDTLEGGNVILNSNGNITGKSWNITNAGKATFDKLYANSSGQIAGWTISSDNISKGSTVLSADKKNGAIQIIDSEDSDYWMNMGVISGHLAVSGINVGNGGVSFRRNATNSSLGNDAWGSLGMTTSGTQNFMHLRVYNKNSAGTQTGFCVSSSANVNDDVPRIEFSPAEEITLRSSGGMYLRTAQDTGSDGFRIFSNKEGTYKTGLTGYVKYVYNSTSTRYLLFVNGLLVGIESSASNWIDAGYGQLT